MIDLRLRSRISPEELDQKVGKIVSDADYNVLLTGPTRVAMPDGKPLCVYLPRILPTDLLDASYETLHALKAQGTDNRGLASGMQRTARGGRNRTRTPKSVASAIIGAFDPVGPRQFCRLTAFTRDEGEQYAGLFPLFQAIAHHFSQHVPDRYAAQMSLTSQTRPEWVVPGTPFTSITVNNSFSTGIHTDKGDLDSGFSNLAVIRKGTYTGGRLVFPEFRVAVDMQHGDLILMDAHQWHGNTALSLESGDAERISVVCYYRSRMATCGTPQEELGKARQYAERRNEKALSALE